MRLQVRTRNERETECVGQLLGEHIPSGTVVGLVGELGCGKTCLVRGLAAGLGIDPCDVASPTFLYLVDYGSGRLPLRHADLYRFEDIPTTTMAEALTSIGLYEAMAREGVTAIEWWDRYVGETPEQLIVVEFVIETVDFRALTLNFSGPALAPAARAFAAALASDERLETS